MGGGAIPRADAPVRLVEERVSVEIAAPGPGRGVPAPGAVLHHLLYAARVAAHFRLLAEGEVGLDVGLPVDPAWASELEVALRALLGTVRFGVARVASHSDSGPPPCCCSPLDWLYGLTSDGVYAVCCSDDEVLVLLMRR